MRCGCPECGAYMVNSEGVAMGCVCAQCGFRCQMCLGTNTVISKEQLDQLRTIDWYTPPVYDDEQDDDE